MSDKDIFDQLLGSSENEQQTIPVSSSEAASVHTANPKTDDADSDTLPDRTQKTEVNSINTYREAQRLSYHVPATHELHLATILGWFSPTEKRPKDPLTLEFSSDETNDVAQVVIEPSHMGRPSHQERRFLMWLVSQVNAVQLEHDVNSRFFLFQPSNYLDWLGVTGGGKNFKAVYDALKCIEGTTYRTNVWLPKSMQPLSINDKRTKRKTTGIVLKPGAESLDSAEQQGSDGVVRQRGTGYPYKLINAVWPKGRKQLSNGKWLDSEEYNDYWMIEIPLQVWMHLVEQTARGRTPEKLQQQNPTILALTQLAHHHCGGRSNKPTARKEHQIYQQLQWAELLNDSAKLNKKRQNLKALLKQNPLLEMAIWYGPRPERPGHDTQSDAANEFMFYFMPDPDGSITRSWQEISKKRGAHPPEILSLYKS